MLGRISVWVIGVNLMQVRGVLEMKSHEGKIQEIVDRVKFISINLNDILSKPNFLFF